ncbi:aminoacyltransferase [Streptococcus cuniculipharyngis]|uniref:Aminoacyltransferase n=1 Tax=Streptococcus cuniculipharyngis TaxID=1562651 RepID=A0A5C5SD89_9STRE|nr:aminoacyltransferase [Streptococcus cuniculipharyngis]TWS99057.1 aminoacyltransferase [Streptococcus cuniculipharyngis]
MYSYKVGISAEEHDLFVENHPQANLLQSSKWAQIKDSWGNERIGVYQDNQLVAAAAILIKPLPLGFTMFYIPRGPIMDYSNQDLVAFVIKSLKELGRKHRAIFIKIDPSLHLKANPVNEETEENPLTLSQVEHLTSLGLDWSGRTMQLAETIQPRFQANLYATDYRLEHLPKKIRQAIRTAKNKGVSISFGHLELVDDFAKLMAKTEDRKHIHLRNKDYYTKLLTTYGDQAYITMATLDLDEKENLLKAALTKSENDLAKYSQMANQSRIKNLQAEIQRLQKELDSIKQARTQGNRVLPLAATLSINFGKTSENLYAGMDEAYRSYNAPLLTWYETAQHAFDMGIDWQNMGGIENDLSGGLYQFKSKLNPVIEEFVGEFNIPVNPLLYKLAMLAYDWRKKLRSKH